MPNTYYFSVGLLYFPLVGLLYPSAQELVICHAKAKQIEHHHCTFQYYSIVDAVEHLRIKLYKWPYGKYSCLPYFSYLNSWACMITTYDMIEINREKLKKSCLLNAI